MNAQELAEKFAAKVAAAVVEKDRQAAIAGEEKSIRADDTEHCKRAMEANVLPFLAELKHHFAEEQFSFSTQIDLHDHKPVGVSFRIGDGAWTSICSTFGNLVVTRIGDSGSSKGVPFVFRPDFEPYISNSGDLTREKVAKLVEMTIDNTRA